MQKIKPSTQTIYFWYRVHHISELERQKIKGEVAQITLALAFGASECLTLKRKYINKCLLNTLLSQEYLKGREGCCVRKISLWTSARCHAKRIWQKWRGAEQNCSAGLLWLDTCLLHEETFCAGQMGACRGRQEDSKPAFGRDSSPKDVIQRNALSGSSSVLCTTCALRYFLLLAAFRLWQSITSLFDL